MKNTLAFLIVMSILFPGSISRVVIWGNSSNFICRYFASHFPEKCGKNPTTTRPNFEQTATPSESTTPGQPTSCPSLADATFKAQMLAGHNERRTRFNQNDVVSGIGTVFVKSKTPIPPLTWNDALANVAQAHSEKCEFRHSKSTSVSPFSYVGENLYQRSWSSCSCEDKTDWDSVVGKWYDEIDYISKKEVCSFMSDLPRTVASNGGVTGHFTQVLWAGTTQVGCGVARCDGCRVIVTCNYGEGGNYVRSSQSVYDFDQAACKAANV